MRGRLTFIQGESGSGKTKYIVSTYSKADSLFLTSETLVEALLNKTFFDGLCAKNVIIEDVDLLKGRTATQELLREYVNRLLASSHNVIISGIHLSRRVPILFELHKTAGAAAINLSRKNPIPPAN